jgi:hypothetical protein
MRSGSWTLEGFELAHFGFNAVLRDYARLGRLFAHDGAWEGRQIIPSQWMIDATTVRPSELAHIPENVRNSEAVRELADWGCLTRMHVVRLLAPRLANENHTKDVDFSPSGIRQRWDAGCANTQLAIEQAPWQGEFDPLEGIILHELRAETNIVQADGGLNPVAISRQEMQANAPRLRAS